MDAAIDIHPASGANAMKALWQKIRVPLANSALFKHGLAWLIWMLLRLTTGTNWLASGSHDVDAVIASESNAIFALWHGQHLIAPALMPRWLKTVALFSRSSDAEINALVAQKFGIETARGSGGRPDQQTLGKGGARALILLRKALDAGKAVCMIADIPGGTPREAGQGIVTLAKISGRRIVPVAIASSRRLVLEKTRDKTTINLPFGHICVIFGDPICVPEDADENMMEQSRRQVTDVMNEITEEAYRKVDNQG